MYLVDIYKNKNQYYKFTFQCFSTFHKKETRSYQQ